MITLKELIGELDFLSNMISTQVRTVGVSLIIVTWGLLMGTSQPGVASAGDLRRKLLGVGALAVIVLFSDFLQYFFGYLYANSVRKEMERNKSKEVLYNYRDLRYRLRGFFFWFKQAILILAVVWFVLAIIPYLKS